MQEFFQRYWQQGLYALLVAAFGWLWKLIKKVRADNDATRDGMTALLRAEIIATYNHYADKGCYLPIYARENLHNLYQQYKTLGSYGDGVVKSKVAGRGWTHWFQCPYIDADNTDAAEDYPLTLNKGDKVKVKDGAKTYTGGKLAAYVYGSVYDVLEVAGNRVVIGIGKTVTAAVRKTDLVKQ